MKALARNKQKFLYCLYSGRKTPIFDEYGNETGEYEVGYEPPVCELGNISPATGHSVTEMFGELDNYDKVIVLDDVNTPIDTNTVLFIDKPYEENAEGLPVFNYTVRRVARSLNSVSIAIRKVEVS